MSIFLSAILFCFGIAHIARNTRDDFMPGFICILLAISLLGLSLNP
jgi:hypothetical protein